MRLRVSSRAKMIFVPLLLCAAVLLVYSLRVRPRIQAAELFRKHIMDPIPASVTQIQADQPMVVGSCVYILRFSVSLADFELIAKSRPFREAEISVYPDGALDWTWKNLPVSGDLGEIGSEFPMYGQRQRRPSWFDLHSWDHSKGYAYRKKGPHEESQVLIYNSILGQAYFIIHVLDGGRPPFFWR